MTREDIENDYRREDNEMLVRCFVGHVGYDYIQHHKKIHQMCILIFQMKHVLYGKK